MYYNVFYIPYSRIDLNWFKKENNDNVSDESDTSVLETFVSFSVFFLSFIYFLL